MSLTYRALTDADIPLGLRLKAQNGWNQLEGDWRRLLTLQPDGGRVALWNGVPVGTACFCIFGEVAWISMVLVDQDHRGHGIGSGLMRELLKELDGRGVPRVRLDATPLGRPVYEKLGFQAEFSLARFEGVADATACSLAADITTEDWTEIEALDFAVTHTRRGGLLRQLADKGPFSRDAVAERGHHLISSRGIVSALRWRVAANQGSGIAGFCLTRPGSNAWQIGPCVSQPDDAPRLLEAVCHSLAGERVYLDVPEENSAAMAWATAAGLTVQRRLLRMSRGAGPLEDLTRYWTSFGPEKG